MYSDDLTLESLIQKNKKMDPNLVPGATPAVTPERFAQQRGIASKIGNVTGPLMQLGGAVTTLAGQPYVGIPLSIAGGGVKGAANEGPLGAVKGAGISAGTAALAAGAGAGLNALKDAGTGSEAIITGSKLSAPLSGAMKDPGMLASLNSSAPSSAVSAAATPTEAAPAMSDAAINQRSNDLMLSWMKGGPNTPAPATSVSPPSSVGYAGPNQLAVSNPATKLTSPYAKMSGMDVMRAMNQGGS